MPTGAYCRWSLEGRRAWHGLHIRCYLQHILATAAHADPKLSTTYTRGRPNLGLH